MTRSCYSARHAGLKKGKTADSFAYAWLGGHEHCWTSPSSGTQTVRISGYDSAAPGSPDPAVRGFVFLASESAVARTAGGHGPLNFRPPSPGFPPRVRRQSFGRQAEHFLDPPGQLPAFQGGDELLLIGIQGVAEELHRPIVRPAG